MQMTYKTEDFIAVAGENNQWVDAAGTLFIGREGQALASLVTELNTPWEDTTPPAVVPNVVSRRQFKMQLAIAGLSTQVSAWVSAQPELVQIAFDESGSFNRNDEMLALGFDAFGFTMEQVDAFFMDASGL
jgi:hypothetical protein